MKILLDESIPRKLKADFGTEHEVWTVKEKGWLGKKNGVLLKLMTDSCFQLFVTVDQNLPYQQNTKELPLTIIILCAPNNRRETLSKLIPKLLESVSGGNLESVIRIS